MGIYPELELVVLSRAQVPVCCFWPYHPKHTGRCARESQRGKIPAHEKKIHWDSPTNGCRPARPCKSCNLTDQ
jgi:hypothetical protein